ncbi:ribbon-helix-helix domain-containing protein [Bosea thiooxidans]
MSDAIRAARAMRIAFDQRPKPPRPLLDALTNREDRIRPLRQVPLRLHPAVHATLVELAGAKKVSINALLHAAIDDLFAAHGRRSVAELDPDVLSRLR